MSTPRLRVALVQLSPVIKDVKASILKANRLTASFVFPSTAEKLNALQRVQLIRRTATSKTDSDPFHSECFRLVPGELDILVLPEMAFSGECTGRQTEKRLKDVELTKTDPVALSPPGYCFTSQEDVGPWLEDATSGGPTFDWATAVGECMDGSRTGR